MTEMTRGYLFSVAGYVLWGVLPLYWKLLQPSGAVEILAHRIVWSVVFAAALLLLLRRFSWMTEMARQPRRLFGITLAAALIAINWGAYIYGVTSGRVVETSLGYFINPLVSVLLGVVVLAEHLRRPQWAAIGLGTLAVVVLAVDYGHVPWLALVLACSFGMYGLMKKKLALPAAEGLFIETSTLAVPALAYLWWLAALDQSSFGAVSPDHTVLLLGSGVATAVPLLFFAGAANRIPLSALGMMQYIGPSLMFLLGVVIFEEPMPVARLAGFALVWAALGIFTWDNLRHRRAVRRADRALATTQPT